MTRITDLPSDVIVIIFSQLDLRDLLAFQSTCRTAYTLVEDDVLWHRLIPTSHLPLPIPLSSALQLSVPALRDTLIKAQQLNENLISSNVTAFQEPLMILGTVENLESRAARLVAPDRDLVWTMSHTSDNFQDETTCTIWNVSFAYEPKVHLHINIPGRWNAVDVSYTENAGIIAVSANLARGNISQGIRIYDFPLDYAKGNRGRLLCRFPIAQDCRVVHVDCCGYLCGVVLRASGFNNQRYYLCFLNALSGGSIVYELPRNSQKDVQLKVFPQHFLLLHRYLGPGGRGITVLAYRMPSHIHSPDIKNDVFDALIPHIDLISVLDSFEQLPSLSDGHFVHVPIRGSAVTSFTFSEHRKLYDLCISVGVREGGVGIHGYPTESSVWRSYVVSLPPDIVSPGARIHEPRQMECSVADINWTSQKWFGSYGRVINCSSHLEKDGTTTIKIYMTTAENASVPLAETNVRAPVTLPAITYDEGRGRLYLMYHDKASGERKWRLNLQIWDLQHTGQSEKEMSWFDETKAV